MGNVSWTVGTRRMSLYTRLYVLGMWLARDKQAFEGEHHTLATARKQQGKGDRPPTLQTRARRHVMSSSLDGMPVWIVRPRRRAPVARVVYLHGGGYIHPLTADYWRLVRALSAAPAEVVVPAYPLAPDATVDEVVPRLLDVVRRAGDTSLPTILMGDSAGGALAIVLAQQLGEAGQPLPAGIVALCPWLDATLDDPEVPELETTDPMLAESGLRAAGRWWAGPRSPDDAVVSPLDGSLDGLPPIDVMIGDRDILRPAVDGLADHARQSDVRLRVLEVPPMFHVWMTRAIPEGARTRRHLRDLVVERTSRV